MDDVPSIGPEFFDVRYAAGKMPWDFGGVPKSLKAFLDTHHESGRVLIPGSGSGYEIEAFSSSGWDVIGIDFSRVAVARARGLLGPLGSKVYEGDFFTYPLREGSFDIIYERTFLCTLLPDFWPRYAQRIAKLVAPAGLLCGFFFLGPEEEPPPWPITQYQLGELLGSWFEKIEDNQVEDSLPLYAGKERWQIWRSRQQRDGIGEKSLARSV
ncbi:MAG TPA: methyltransferase domain-containing protein [Terrimicrobiaceae bacterium]